MKSYLYTTPEGASECYPYILNRELKAGWEKVTIRVPRSFFFYLAERGKNGANMVKVVLAEIYPAYPPVDPRDVVAPLLDIEEEEVVFSIRRGHLFLAQFFKEHESPTLTSDGLTCACHPEKVERFYPTAIPDYKLSEISDD